MILLYYGSQANAQEATPRAVSIARTSDSWRARTASSRSKPRTDLASAGRLGCPPRRARYCEQCWRYRSVMRETTSYDQGHFADCNRRFTARRNGPVHPPHDPARHRFGAVRDRGGGWRAHADGERRIRRPRHVADHVSRTAHEGGLLRGRSGGKRQTPSHRPNRGAIVCDFRLPAVRGADGALRYWASHGKPKRISTPSGGWIAVEPRGKESITAAGKQVALDRYTIDGLMFGREIVWMDAQQNLAAAMTFAGGLPMEAVRDENLSAPAATL